MNTKIDNTKWTKFPKPDWLDTPPIKKVSDCLHDNCSSCGGTGIRKDGLGMCVHMISCPCRKCSPWC